MARIASDVILAGEIMPRIDGIIESNKGKYPDDVLQRQRELMIREALKKQIENKLIYLDLQQTIPKENFPQVEKNVGKQFDEVELPRMLKQAKVETRRQLSEKLEKLGTSLQREKRAFVQRVLAQSWIHEQVKSDEQIPHQDLIDYYHRHATDFDKPARARWKELMVRFSKYPTKAEAGAAIARMGNRVVVTGVPFETVAKGESQGTTAAEGGVREWTTQGSLVSDVLDRALFDPHLAVGRPSPILESDNAFHIILVTQRELAHRTPFREAQVEIKKKIEKQRTSEQIRAYVFRLKQRIPVWTVFDQQTGTSTGTQTSTGG